MSNRSRQSGLSRRVVAYYLFFCMLAVTWLSLGVLTTARSVLSSRATSSCLSKLGQVAASIELDLLRNGGAATQRLIEQACNEGRLAFCAVVGADGRYLAHTNPLLVGAPAAEPTGGTLHWGNVAGIRHDDAVYGMLSEYRVPLAVNNRRHGELRLAVVEPNFLTVVADVADAAPIAILLPVGCVIGGALLLRRMVGPFEGIEQRLREIARTPFGEPLPLEPVADNGVAAAGWNRIVEKVSSIDQEDDSHALEVSIKEALNRRRGTQTLEVLQALREGIAVTDAKGRVEFANVAVAALLDLDCVSGNAESSLLEQLAGVSNGAEPILAAAGSSPVVAEVEAPGDGEARTLRVERQPVDGAGGRAIWSIRDITQQKLAEASRDQFIDAATHELRTPLANIKAYAETLAGCDVEDPEQQKEFFNTINSEATRLARFVDDLLDISSMEVGSLTIRRQNVDIQRLFREAVEKVRPVIEKKSQAFEVLLPPKLGEMHLDKDKVSVLLVNLLGNASKYTPEGGAVRFKAEATESAISVTIADTGVGISQEELPQVFDKFFRSEDPRVRGESGTGLGLSLAREIARLHGGDITVVSDVGEGSAFTVTLPRSARDAV
ncbi:MAG: ATP-binding protein [Planctomycetota bacterium]